MKIQPHEASARDAYKLCQHPSCNQTLNPCGLGKYTFIEQAIKYFQMQQFLKTLLSVSRFEDAFPGFLWSSSDTQWREATEFEGSPRSTCGLQQSLITQDENLRLHRRKGGKCRWAAVGRGIGTLWPEDTSKAQSIPLPTSPARSRGCRPWRRCLWPWCEWDHSRLPMLGQASVVTEAKRSRDTHTVSVGDPGAGRETQGSWVDLFPP